MIDWTKSMQQTYEFYEVDPGTWKDRKRLNMFTGATIDRDDDNNTLGSASFDVTEDLNECYVRTYLVVTQNGETKKIPLGTHLVQSPNDNFDGRNHKYTLDGYTPLLELKEGQPPLGFNVPSGSNIMASAYRIIAEHVRCPVVAAKSDSILNNNFISDIDEDWFSFCNDLIANGGYSFDIDGYGVITFAPDQDTAALTPVFTYTDDNSSILLPEIQMERDISTIPNVVEVLYSANSGYLYGRAVNDDPSSPTSIQSRGREITHRVTDPELYGAATQAQVDEYARNTLKSLSTLDCKLTYSHGFNEVRVKDCVRLNYERSGIVGINAKVVSQSIECKTGCTVSEVAVFTRKLWG